MTKDVPTAAPRREVSTSLCVLSLAALFLLLVLALGVHGDFPLDDDWVYRRSVGALLAEGRLLAPSASVNPWQTFWGALFCLPSGLSSVSLRVSTLVLSLASVLALFHAGRTSGLPKEGAAAAALLLLANPLFLPLSFTFMTDVHFLAWTLGAMLCFARGLREDDGLSFAGAALFASLALLVKQNGVLLPVGMLLHLAVCGKLDRRRALLAAALPALAACASGVWFRWVHGETLLYRLYMVVEARAHLAHPLRFLHACGNRLVIGALLLALFTAPFTLASLRREDVRALARPWGVFLAALLAAYHARFGLLPLKLLDSPQGMLNRYGLGTITLGGRADKTAGVFAETWFWALLTLVAAASLLVLASRARRPTRETFAREPLLLPSLALFLPLLASPRFFDRYLLCLLPCAALMSARRVRESRRRWAAALAGTAALLAFSAAGTADYLAWNRAKWALGAAVVRGGLPAERLLNGMDWGGLYLFDRNLPALERRALGGPVRELDWLRMGPYDALVSFSARDPSVPAASIPYRTPLRPFRGGRLYLHRSPAPFSLEGT